MVDTVSHATQGALALLAPFISSIKGRAWLWLLGILGAFFGALPDLIGAYGNFIEHDHWALYISAHRGPIKEVLQYIPMYWLHLYIDSLTHGEHHRWWKMDERFWLEVSLWVLNLLFVWWHVKIWKRNHQYPANR